MMVARQIQVLLTGSDPEQARLVTETLQQIHSSVHLRHIPEADQALVSVRGQGLFRRRIHPNLIFLDADHEPERCLEVLKQIKSDPDLEHIPVVILASQQTDSDVRTAYNLFANCCVSKPISKEELMRTLELMNQFWLTIAKLPFE
jgi:chemotaxis family two-component system response regulator Rcp1